MKKSGLKNRFPPEVREFWEVHNSYRDMWDGRNDGDVLHHIKSPSSYDYVAGKHNESLLNSTLLNNFRNHIGNGELHHLDTEKELVLRTFNLAIDKGYVLNYIDQEFLTIYKLL